MHSHQTVKLSTAIGSYKT